MELLHKPTYVKRSQISMLKVRQTIRNSWNFLFGTEGLKNAILRPTKPRVKGGGPAGPPLDPHLPLLLKLLFFGLKNKVSIYSLKGQCCKE